MNIWKKGIRKLSFELSKRNHPVMVAGYRDSRGKYLSEVRISNMTFIDHPENLLLEDNIFIGHFNFIEASNIVSIGEGCQITNYVSITSHSSHNSIRLYGKQYTKESKHIGYVKGPVNIGKYTFIGPHSLILPNTRIGKGSIISSYSKVQGEFPDFSIIKGDPAKIIGDTREIDKKYLEMHPELKKFYDGWATMS